jgi:hypothetical protein
VCGQTGDGRTEKLTRRLCSTRALARTLASTRRAATGWSASFQEDESQLRQAVSKTTLTTGNGSNASSAPPSSDHEAPRG